MTVVSTSDRTYGLRKFDGLSEPQSKWQRRNVSPIPNGSESPHLFPLQPSARLRNPPQVSPHTKENLQPRLHFLPSLARDLGLSSFRDKPNIVSFIQKHFITSQGALGSSSKLQELNTTAPLISPLSNACVPHQPHSPWHDHSHMRNTNSSAAQALGVSRG